MTHLIVRLLFTAIVFMTMAACNYKGNEIVNDYNNELNHSSLLSMYKVDGYTKVDIKNPWDTCNKLASYLLVPTDSGLPDCDEDTEIIRTPVKSLLVYTSVYAGAIKELGKIDVVTGVTDAQFYKIPEVIEGLKNQKIIDAGKADSPITERIIELSPDAILLSIYQGIDINAVEHLHIPILKFVDNMETTPLGRAEWIKLLGELTGRREQADSIFNHVENEYLSLKAITEHLKSNRPKILVENMYQGVWYVSGGKSYQATMIKDAGGDYVWSDDNSTGSLFLSFEQVLDKADDADIWLLKVFGKELTKEELIKMDSRNSLFAPFNNGGVYYSNTAESNLFEEFPFHPELMLKDYINIFHPEILENYTPKYFKKMIE